MKFRTTFLVAIMAIVAGIIAPTTVVIGDLLEAEARDNLGMTLDRSDTVFKELQAYRQSQYATHAKVTAGEPRVKAVIASDEIDHATMLDVAVELRGAMEADIFLMTDGEGSLLADTADAKAEGHDLSGIPLVAKALKEGNAGGIWADDRGVVQVQAQRIAFGETVVGAVISGYRINDSVAQTIYRQTGSIVFVLRDGDIVASAAGDKRNDALKKMSAAASTTELGAHAQIEIEGERFIALAHPLPGYRGGADVRYVLLQSLDDALVASREINDLLYKVGAAGLLAAAVCAFLIGWRLSSPLASLVDFTKTISEGKLDTKANIGGPTEVRHLGLAMNTMASDLSASRQALDESLRKIETINAGLEETVAERTAELRATNAEVVEMLDNLNDAVFIVNGDMIVEGRVSPACSTIFGFETLTGMDVTEFLFGDDCSDDNEAPSVHRLTLMSGTNYDVTMWELNCEHLLREVKFRRTEPDGTVSTRYLEISYAPLLKGDDVERVMIIARDQTDLLALKQSVAEEQEKGAERVSILLELVRGSRQRVYEFLNDGRERAERIQQCVRDWSKAAGADPLTLLFRHLHTIKGNARLLELRTISTHTHDVEDVVHQLQGAEDDDPRHAVGTPEHEQAAQELTEATEGLIALLGRFIAIADELRSDDSGKATIGNVQDTAARIRGLAEQATGNVSQNLNALADLLIAQANEEVVSVNALFAEHGGLVHDIGPSLGKEVPFEDCIGTPGYDLFIVSRAAGCVRDAMNHAIRNALDHGLESPEQRVAANKPREGRIWVEWSKAKQGYRVSICDDGGGINVDHVRRMSIERGLLEASATPTDDELIELLFLPGFSSKDEVTDVSGRGAGLDAIRAGMEKLGGSAKLTSVSGKGSALELSVPAHLVRFVEVRSQILPEKSPAVIAA